MKLDAIYDSDFFATTGDGSLVAARRILRVLWAKKQYASIVDVGCGIGSWLLAASELGATQVKGIDGPHIPAQMLLVPSECISRADLAQPLEKDSRFDLCLCLEVAEHLPPERGPSLVEDLTDLSSIVVFSAAIPFQGGNGHCNEMWPEYWARLFASRGYLPWSGLRDAIWTERDIPWWYRQNLLVFVHESEWEAFLPDQIPADPKQLTAIHPESYLWNVSRDKGNAATAFARDRAGYYSFLTDSDTPPTASGEFSETLPAPAINHFQPQMHRTELMARVIREVTPYTMVPPENLAQTISLVIASVEADLPGDLVECGTWMGGSSFAMLLAQRYCFGRIIKPVWMFDSFQGLPPADERDGPLAASYQRETSSPLYFNNCTARIDQVRAAMDRFGFGPDEAILVEGWFHETLPLHCPSLSRSGVAVLRIDCDWYEPVLFVLEQLASLVPEEGAVILDDYYAWDGCARATHEFLSRHSLSWRIRSMDKFKGAWMIKREHRKLEQELLMTANAGVLPYAVDANGGTEHWRKEAERLTTVEQKFEAYFRDTQAWIASQERAIEWHKGQCESWKREAGYAARTRHQIRSWWKGMRGKN